MLAPIGGGAGDFAVSAGEAPTQRLHVAFWVPSHELVDAFWQTGIDAGFTDDGAPGPRTQYRSDYYGAFLLDPDGNSAEAVHHGDARTQGQVDHLWVRVPDLAAARDQHRDASEAAGFALSHDGPERVQFKSPSASFSFVVGEPTRNIDLGFLSLR